MRRRGRADQGRYPEVPRGHAPRHQRAQSARLGRCRPGCRRHRQPPRLQQHLPPCKRGRGRSRQGLLRAAYRLRRPGRSRDRDGERRGQRQRSLPEIYGGRRQRGEDLPLSEKDQGAAALGGYPSHQQHSRHNQLCPHRDRAAHARVRSHLPCRRQDNSAPRGRGRAYRHPRRKRQHPDFGHADHTRRREAGRGRRRDGRREQRHKRRNERDNFRICKVCPRQRAPHFARARTALGQLRALRKGRGFLGAGVRSQARSHSHRGDGQRRHSLRAHRRVRAPRDGQDGGFHRQSHRGYPRLQGLPSEAQSHPLPSRHSRQSCGRQGVHGAHPRRARGHRLRQRHSGRVHPRLRLLAHRAHAVRLLLAD